jgi:hypothetical protein
LQEAVIKKKYGGILPRKTPLISKVNNIALQYIVYMLFKLRNTDIYENVDFDIEISFQDHERAYFDSADWALGKVIDSPSIPHPQDLRIWYQVFKKCMFS